jgi:DNA polymerase-3 subunit gamma/tau
MSYLALARKYRPRQFPDVMGQDHVVKALSHALDGDKLHPAILLTGTRGVGKTTLARIIAKCLNCETGVSAHPCGVCSACTEVDSGRFVDLLEIDAASNTGVDDVRQLIDNAQYSPARGRYKVYLIDEVHMLSKSAFNALLKTLEEPPPHVKFILATTDPQKLLVTVLSRCLQFNLKRLPVAVIRDQLIKVLGDENIDFETAAVVEIARSADGSMRDGLSLLDQAIAFAGGQPLQRQTVEDMLGSGGRQTLLEIIAALATRNAGQLLSCLQKLEAQSPDYAALINDLSAAMQRIAVLQMLPGSRTEDDDEALVALTTQFAPEDVQLGYQIAIGGRRDMPWAPDPRLGFEMTVLRMLAFQPDEAAPAGAAPATGGGTVRSSNASTRSDSGSAATAVPRASGAAQMETLTPTPQLPVDASWPQRVEAMQIEGFTRQLARHCAWVSRTGNVVQLELDPQVRHVLQEDRRAELEAQLRLQLGADIQLRIDTAQEQVELASPAVLAKQAEIARQRAAEESIQADPVVRAFRDHFGAQIRPGSIHPLDS